MDGIEVTDGGWVVSDTDEKGKTLYVGRDGFWTRIKQAAAPFKDYTLAHAAAQKLKMQRAAKWS